MRTRQTGRDGITGENLLHQKKKRNFWLLLGAFLFAFHGVLHPLFHAETHPDERTTETAAYRNDFSKRCAPAISLHCPVCSGIFQAAELPELLLLPEVSRSVLQYPEYPGLPFSRRSTGFRARAPPCLARLNPRENLLIQSVRIAAGFRSIVRNFRKKHHAQAFQSFNRSPFLRASLPRMLPFYRIQR